MKKQCKKCKKLLELIYFAKGNAKFGKCSWCKNCYKIYRKTHFKDRKQEKSLQYINQKSIYPWMSNYKNAKQRCNNYKCKDYNRYGGRGIKFILSKEEIKKLWFRDKAYLMEKPSIDRTNNDGNYEINNCKFIEFKINISKAIKYANRNEKGQFINKIIKTKGSK